MYLFTLIAVIAGMPCGKVSAAEVRVAVAANFATTAKLLAREYQRQHAHTVVLVPGSTGKLYAQILQRAPFDIFLSADQLRPRRLHEQQLGAAPFTYAVGRLVLWSANSSRVRDQSTLTGKDFGKLALANPKTAPYGQAGVQVMRALGIEQQLRSRLVFGESIAQAYQFTASGNADLGFVALAQVVKQAEGSRWLVPQRLYDPVRQDGILLNRGAGNAAAQSFLAYLNSDRADRIIHDFGYATD